MIELAIKLILAHFAGDFLLQPNRWIEKKEDRKFKSPYLYYHIAVHAIVLLVLLKFDINYWFGFLLIITSHYIIDLVKLNLKGKYSDKKLFIADQTAHLLFIILVLSYYEKITFNIELLYSVKSLLLITTLIFITSVSSVIIKFLILNWKIKTDENASLNKAGTYIGMLERLFVFGFIIINYWEGIGFLIAAKSVFRFGDLSKASEIKLTEYILLGTLLSFGLAILTGVSFEYLTEIIR